MRKKEIKSTPLLDNVAIAAPCSVSWDSMTGNNRERLCQGCSKSVYNLSAMTKSEAEKFLQENGTSKCAIFYRRFDGTIMTDDCPVGLRRLRDAGKWVIRAAAGIVALVVALPATFAQMYGEAGRSSSKNGNIFEPLTNALNNNKVLQNQPPRFYDNPAGGMRLPPNLQTNNTNQPPVHNTIPPKQPPKHVQQPLYPTVLKNMDAVALGYFKKGEQAEKEGHKQLAEFFYEKALDAYDKQSAGDFKFRQQIQQALQNLNAH